MKRLMVAMFRPNIDNLPAPSIPGDGFRIRGFGEGDENTWARIECQAGEFDSEMAAKERFLSDFPDPNMLRNCCLFVENNTGEAVGTAMTMSGQLAGRKMGRLGWVAVSPHYQERELGKWMVAVALQDTIISNHQVCNNLFCRIRVAT
ncbi:MAG: GNAT family N-acetyltransferase [Bacilli bacterium]